MNSFELYNEIVEYNDSCKSSALSTTHTISYLEFSEISEFLKSKYVKYSIDKDGDVVVLTIPTNQINKK